VEGGAPIVVDIGGVRQGVSCYRPSIQSRKVSVAVLAQFWLLKLNFCIHNLGKRGPLWGWSFVVSDGVSVTS